MKTLRMEFTTGEDKNFVVSLPNAKDGLTQAAVTAAMNVLIAQDIFVTALTGIESADVVTRTEDPIIGA